MKIAKYKIQAIAIALCLMFAMSTLLIFIPTAKAEGTMKTYSYLGATPNPIGVGQQTLLHIGITQQLTNVNMGWEGVTVTVTKPDGTTETLGPIRTDSTGGTGIIYVPTVVGNYTLQSHYPQQVTRTDMMAGSTPVNTTMLASNSEKLTLVVQQEARVFYPGIPLPTEYWFRPINAQFREWYTVGASSWMNSNYNQAPMSPHVLWTKPLTTGGLVGGDLGLVGSGATSVAMENGDAYEGKFATRLILMGRLYYTTGAYDRPRLIHCVDLHTGEEIWAKTFLDNQTIGFAQLFYWQSYNVQGTYAYLWVTVGTTWTGFDPFTGEYMCSITNVPSGTRITGPNGEVYLYTVNSNAGYMTLWNLTALVSMGGSYGSAIQTRTLNASATVNASTTVLSTAAARAWAYNITIPKGLPGSVRAVALNDRVVGSSLNTTDVVVWSFSLKKGQEGTLLFKNGWKAPADWSEGNQTLSWAATSLSENVGLVWSKEGTCHYAFSLETGEYLWKTASETYLDIYDAGRNIYEGKLISVGQGGIVYCYNLTTGATMWIYRADDIYTEMLWSSDWPMDSYFPTGGKVYFFQTEHSANQPLPRGAPAFCLNATTGAVIWRVDGLLRDTHWGGEAILGDSIIAMYNTYDQQVYALGKGPSATTVSAPDTGVPLDVPIVIKGTVTDISPGTTDYSVTARFPNGVPAVSDYSQGEWMKYVYAQFPRPTNITGVPVTISVLDSNGNYRDIGQTTSDADGFFSFTWKPDIEGKYNVYATFEGSESYWPSHAVTAFNVDPVAPTATPQPLAERSVSDQYFVPAVAGIIIAIAIVGAVLALLLLKKRP
jgi:outer membrane protein assembly factor BamB